MMKRISRKEAQTARQALARLEARFKQGQITRGLYVAQRETLHDILSRPVAENTAVKTNTRSWFARNLIDNSAAPVGYFGFNQQHATDSITPPTSVGSNMNKVRQGMLNLATNEYWNSGNIMEKLQAQAQPVVNQAQATNSYYNEAIRHANGLNAGLGSTNPQQVLNNIETNPEVQAAVRALSASINTLIRERVANGASPSNARTELISLAISSGAKITGMGYDAQAAADIVTRVMKGQLTEMQGVYEMASDLREANKILNSLGSRPNSSIRPGSGILDQIYATPLPGRERYISNDYRVDNMRPRVASLNMPYGTLDLPTLRSMAQQASEQGDEAKVLAIQQAISLRQEALQSVRRGGKTTQQGQPSSGLSPEFQSRALNFSQSTRNAIQMQKPDMASVLRDVFSVDGNSYFNTQAGSQIFVGNDSTANDPAYLKPAGDFTVFGKSPAGLENMMNIKQSLLYTMASPAWDDADKAYLEYLLGRINQQIEMLQDALTIKQTVQTPFTQSGKLTQQVNLEQNILNPEIEWHYHYNSQGYPVEEAPNVTMSANGEVIYPTMPQSENNSLHNKGFTHNTHLNNNKSAASDDNDEDIQQKLKQNSKQNKQGNKSFPNFPGGGSPSGGLPRGGGGFPW